MAAARTSQSSEVLALPAVAELVAGVPARVWLPDAPISNSDRRVTEASAAIQSSMPLANRFTLDLGLRAEISNGEASGAAAGISWGTLSPRVFFRWAPKAVTIFGGFSRYQPRLSPDLLAFGDPGEPVVNVHRWLDTDDDGRLDAGETGTLVALTGRGPAIASIDPNLKPPRVDEYALSAEHRFSHTFVRVTAVVRRSRNIPRSVDVGVPTSGYAVVLVPDGDTTQGSNGLLTVYDRLPSTFGQDRYLLTNVPNDEAAYDGLEVDWGLETPRWYSMAGIAAYRSNGSGGNRGFHVNENDQGVIGETLRGSERDDVLERPPVLRSRVRAELVHELPDAERLPGWRHGSLPGRSAVLPPGARARPRARCGGDLRRRARYHTVHVRRDARHAIREGIRGEAWPGGVQGGRVQPAQPR